MSCRTNDKSKIVSLSDKLNNKVLNCIAVVIKSITENKKNRILAGPTF